ncbi:MAG: hypothetical protein K2F60_05330 [Oscillospiraceae bacterium]|nr:hypothetical protein [Oscillospiraceae bacterium]
MNKIIALIFTVIFSAVLLCGCNDDEKGSSVAYEDFEYGATVRQILNGNIDLYFDGRFLTDEEMNTVSDYFYAIETGDLELFKSVQPDYFAESLEKQSGSSLESYLNDAKNDIVKATGEDFKFVSIEATDCGDSSTDEGIADIIDMLNGIYEENDADTTFEATVKDSKFILADITITVGEEDYTYSDKLIYIFNCGDDIFILS